MKTHSTRRTVHFLTLLAAIACCGPLRAETLPPATLSLTARIDTGTGDTLGYRGIFIVRGEQLLWGPDEAGAMVLAITGREGTWDKATNRGEIIYGVKFGELEGKVTITGSEAGLVVEVEMVMEGQVLRDRLLAGGITYN